MTEYSIRPAVLEDTADAEVLLAELGYPRGDPDARSRVELLLTARRVYTRVVEEEGSLLGLISAQFIEMFPYRVLFVTILVVHPQARKRGIGRALLRTMDEFGLQNGCAQVMGVVRADLPQNHHFYGGLGYEQAGIRYLKECRPSGDLSSNHPNERK